MAVGHPKMLVPSSTPDAGCQLIATKTASTGMPIAPYSQPPRRQIMKPTYHRHDDFDDHDYELTYWSEKLGIPRDKLRAVVVKEGSMRRAVEKARRLGGRDTQRPDFTVVTDAPKTRPARLRVR
jgi:hypothetical protein